MKKLFFATVILAFMAVQAGMSQADVISVKEFSGIMKKPGVVLVSARTAADYAKVHATGAVHIDHKSLYKDSPVKSMLKSPAEIGKILGSKGISNSSQVVIYDDGTGKYAGRLYWIMDYMGAENVKVLDGHMQAWRVGRKPVTKAATTARAATFTAKPDASKIATISEVKSAGAGTVVVDVRSPEEFNGTNESELRKGHIPGAVNFEFSQVMNEKKMLKPAAELQSLFNAAGITKDKQVILYCESSVRAGIVYLALKSALSYPKVKVYDGAFLEWQASASNKVVK